MLIISDFLASLSPGQRLVLMRADKESGRATGHALITAALVRQKLAWRVEGSAAVYLTEFGVKVREHLQETPVLFLGPLTFEDVENITDMYLAQASIGQICAQLGVGEDDVMRALAFKRVLPRRSKKVVA